ncbi:UNVERIFIED_CONTAM: hypothetical protein Slati_4292800 [Sesamum latifolium]|uniref:Transposase MuDR plant domain-containing protein n=1 Tax=Sesamum latifolium TaxID=2727402 RepID=A0AAW2TCU3_9LAMI
MIVDGSWRWPAIPGMGYGEITHDLRPIHGGQDSIQWNGGSVRLTNRVAYELFQPRSPKVEWSSLLLGPLKIHRNTFILWLAILGRLSTLDKPWLHIYGKNFCLPFCYGGKQHILGGVGFESDATRSTRADNRRVQKDMVLDDFADFDVWVGGVIEWVPRIRYVGGTRVWFPNVDREILYYGDLLDMYVKAGGKGLNVVIYFCLLGRTLENGIRMLNGDEGIRELLLTFKGLSVIPIYFEEKQGLLLVVDSQGNILSQDEQIPYLPYNAPNTHDANNAPEIDEATNAPEIDENYPSPIHNPIPTSPLFEGAETSITEEGEGGDDCAEDGERGFEGAENCERDGEGVENGEGGIEWGFEGVENGEGGLGWGFEGAENGVEGAGNSEGAENGENDVDGAGNEDLEGPLDNDIFEHRPPDHTRKLFKVIRAFVREQRKKKRAEEEQRQEDERNLRGEGWFTDASVENDIESLRGSDNEDPSFPVWNERMNFDNEELSVGMKFPTREKYREVLRDWAVRRGWDLKFQHNETKKITATCKHGCAWRIHASQVMKTTTFQIKSIKEKHTCAHRIENKQANYKYLGKRIENIIRDNPSEGLISLKNKIRRDVQVDCSLHKVYRAKRYALQLIKGNIKLQYERLYDYCSIVCKYNPESTLVLKHPNVPTNGSGTSHAAEIPSSAGINLNEIPACNNQTGLSQNEHIFSFSEIPQASHASQFMPSTQGSQPMTNEMPQTSQFMTSSQGSQSRTNEIPQASQFMTSSQDAFNFSQVKKAFFYSTNIKARFCAVKVFTVHFTFEIPLQPAQISTATQPPSNSNAQMHQSLQPSDRPVHQALKRRKQSAHVSKTAKMQKIGEGSSINSSFQRQSGSYTRPTLSS